MMLNLKIVEVLWQIFANAMTGFGLLLQWLSSTIGGPATLIVIIIGLFIAKKT